MKKIIFSNLIALGFVTAMFFVIACKKNTDQQATIPIEQEDVLAGNGINEAILKMESYNDSLHKASNTHDKKRFDVMYHHHDSLHTHHHTVYHHGDTIHHHAGKLHTTSHHHTLDSTSKSHHKISH